MFDKQAVDAYRSLTAPDALKERVMTATTRKISVSTKWMSIAACVAVVLMCGAFWLYPAEQVHLTAVPSSDCLSYAGAASRSTEQYAVITLKGNGAIHIQTNDTFYIEKNGSLQTIGRYHLANDDVILHWPIGNTQAALTVNGVSYTLVYSTESGNITLVQD